jgi:hypothetical protein
VNIDKQPARPAAAHRGNHHEHAQQQRQGQAVEPEIHPRPAHHSVHSQRAQDSNPNPNPKWDLPQAANSGFDASHSRVCFKASFLGLFLGLFRARFGSGPGACFRLDDLHLILGRILIEGLHQAESFLRRDLAVRNHF